MLCVLIGMIWLFFLWGDLVVFSSIGILNLYIFVFNNFIFLFCCVKVIVRFVEIVDFLMLFLLFVIVKNFVLLVFESMLFFVWKMWLIIVVGRYFSLIFILFMLNWVRSFFIL